MRLGGLGMRLGGLGLKLGELLQFHRVFSVGI